MELCNGLLHENNVVSNSKMGCSISCRAREIKTTLNNISDCGTQEASIVIILIFYFDLIKYLP